MRFIGVHTHEDMASATPHLQLLINEGELSEIVRVINDRGSKTKIVGCLFGLWRNSLLQPVVQLVTGPGKNAKLSKKNFTPDSRYHDRITRYLEEEHGLLQIGLWCSGSAERYPRLNRRSTKFNLQTSLIPKRGRYIVLMFIDTTEESLEIEYQIIDKTRPESCRIARLSSEDVLPGASNFRLPNPIYETLNHGALCPFSPEKHTGYFSIAMIERNHDRREANATPSHARAAPANLVPPTSQSTSSQWYESDGGLVVLRELKNGFQAHNVPVNMSRHSKSHDLTLEVNQSICLHFPADFPASPVSFTWLNDSSNFKRNPDRISGAILTRALDVISYETALNL